MKCEILCPPCAVNMEKVLGDGRKYPGEHVKYVKGTAKRNPYKDDGLSVCDGCEVELPAGAPCTAMTIWSERSPNPYNPWEIDFIEPAN